MIYLSNILSNNFLKFFLQFLSQIFIVEFLFFLNPNKISDFYSAIENVGKENYIFIIIQIVHLFIVY